MQMKSPVCRAPGFFGRWLSCGFAIAAVLGITMCCPGAIAQSGAGSIQGTVKDPTGAVIPGAKIMVVNQATGVTSHTTSNKVGFYQVPGLFTGVYKVSVTATNMETYNHFVDLQVAQTAVINPVMTAGAVSQQVTVKGQAVQLTDTTNGVIGGTLENARINQLPMNGRNLITLVQETTPGLTNCSQSSSCPNGLMGEAMTYVADGASLANREFGGTHEGQLQMPDPDSVQQVKVLTSGAGARYETPATAVITTKSGTNRIHGSLFETARNSYFGVAKARQDPSNFVAPHLVRNEFGASAGGPILVPHIYNGRNKSFWFFAYERYSLRHTSYQLTKVPSLAMRQGDFSGAYNSSGILQTIYDPNSTAMSSSCAVPASDGGGTVADQWCRTAFPGNKIPIGRLSPTGKIIDDITIKPTDDSVNPLVADNVNSPAPDNSTIPTYTFRLDEAFNQSNHAYLRYTQNTEMAVRLRNDPHGSTVTVPADGFPAAASGLYVYPNSTFAAALGFTHIFSPTFFSETVASQTWMGEVDDAGGNPSTNYEKKLGLPNNFGEPGFPYFAKLLAPLDGSQFLYGVTDIMSDLDENLTKTVGRHQMEFGFRFTHDRFASRPDEHKDEIEFNTYGTALEDPSTGSSYHPFSDTGLKQADLFLGAPYNYGVNLQPPIQHMHQWAFDFYYEDHYHMTTNFTVDLGLRYEVHPAIWEKYGLMEGFDLKNDALVMAAPPAKLISEGYTTQAVITNDKFDGVKFETPAEAGVPANTLVNNSDFTFGPRFGFAWQPFGKVGTVLRGSSGRYIYPEPIRSVWVSMGRSNPLTVGYGQNFDSSSLSPDGKPNFLLRAPQTTGTWTSSTMATPVMGLNTANAVDSTSTTAIHPGFGIVNLNRDFPPNYVNEVNFSIEQPMPANSVLRISYLYNHASNLDQDWEYNNSPSTYVWELMTGIKPPTGGTSVIGTPQQDTYSSTATRPYDQTTYGGNYQIQKSGWSNYNGLNINYQRLFHNGFAWQINYVWSKTIRVGGNGGRDSKIYPIQNYATSGLGTVSYPYGTPIAAVAPPSPPAGIASYAYYHGLDRFESYTVDTGFPKQLVNFNWIVDLPFGRGKHFLGGVNKPLNEVVGGWQLAGSGQVESQDFGVNTGMWGPDSALHTYKQGKPIMDCTSGTCFKEYLWFNGYIPATTISGNPCAASSGSKVITGLPSDYQPYASPSDTTCDSSGHSKYFGDNEVAMTLLDGKTENISYDPGPTGANPYQHTILNGPMNWTADASIFKVFPITEHSSLRFNMDAFNVFNVQGFNNPSKTSGIESLRSSHNTPRQIQFTLRYTF